MVSGTDPETLRFLDDIILLAVHCNPDGHDLAATTTRWTRSSVSRSVSPGGGRQVS